MASKERSFKVSTARMAEPSAPRARTACLALGPRAVFALALLAPVGCGMGDAGEQLASGGSAGPSGGSGGAGSSSSSGTGGPPQDPSALCVNEIMPNNVSALDIGMGVTPDWLELHNVTDADVDLEGWSLTDDESNPKRSVLPKGMMIPAKGFLILFADGEPALGPDHLAFKLAAAGEIVGLYTPEGQGSVTTYGITDPDYAQARKPDCCAGDACIELDYKGTPGKSNQTPKPMTVTVLPEGSVYRYWDKGSVAASWIDPGFNDGAWAMGAAPLGYGDPHIITNVGYGPDAQGKYITTWFRTTFEVKGVGSAATIGILRDDGAVIFLNGVEVARSNMPTGVIAAGTPALSSAASETTFVDITIDPAALVSGTNVLAIEVHQVAAGSTDLGMDARVSVVLPAP